MEILFLDLLLLQEYVFLRFLLTILKATLVEGTAMPPNALFLIDITLALCFVYPVHDFLYELIKYLITKEETLLLIPGFKLASNSFAYIHHIVLRLLLSTRSEGGFGGWKIVRKLRLSVHLWISSAVEASMVLMFKSTKVGARSDPWVTLIWIG